MQVYIAFSIHGTGRFITAMKEVEQVSDVTADKAFTVVKSRNVKYYESLSTKLHYSKLLTAKGEPLRSPPTIVKIFNDLEKDGWIIKKEGFISKHWKNI